jgi:hypothetical protein
MSSQHNTRHTSQLKYASSGHQNSSSSSSSSSSFDFFYLLFFCSRFFRKHCSRPRRLRAGRAGELKVHLMGALEAIYRLYMRLTLTPASAFALALTLTLSLA